MSEVQRTIKLGSTDGFRYIGINPSLTKDELEGMPKPIVSIKRSESLTIDCFSSVERHDDGTMDIGFTTGDFEYSDEIVQQYAQELGQYLGNCAVDTEIRPVGPGSVTQQSYGELAE